MSLHPKFPHPIYLTPTLVNRSSPSWTILPRNAITPALWINSWHTYPRACCLSPESPLADKGCDVCSVLLLSSIRLSTSTVHSTLSPFYGTFSVNAFTSAGFRGWFVVILSGGPWTTLSSSTPIYFNGTNVKTTILVPFTENNVQW